LAIDNVHSSTERVIPEVASTSRGCVSVSASASETMLVL